MEFRNAPPGQNETWLFPASKGGADHASLISLFFGQEGLCHAYTVTFCVPMDEGRERTDGGSCAYALLANVIVAGEGASFHDLPHFAGGIVPGDDIFTTWSYRAGAGRSEAFLLNPQPLTARTAHEWGVVAEVVANGKALSRARELAALQLKVPEVTRRNTACTSFIH